MANKQTEYHYKYDKANTRQIKLKLNIGTDNDILEKLDKVPNKQGYIKALIRQDIAASAANPEENKPK